ncbi:MAG: glycosyltransferase family 2 protein [Bacteroidales bacterium]|jgi:glycosyltransferase involved in cell wall biosynthesis|nr:glycosyltransferase family 2 protein [Bacteroidales bacterium]MDD2204549.1 glycosyltransferase family 2 protein [Bacteroidales bacterium]MDD3913490.1 glycosyltransferase family 2 protein [Bacteroidales bacterium]MDD4633979.1 glycosyltransferase family 2 protein [Bacteroidales bacterium]
MKLSAVIITFNEEMNIRRCLASLVGAADEIVVLDSFSTDNTAEICSDFPAVKFHQREWTGYSDAKNYANSLATNDFILSVDADETLSDKLKNSILEVKDSLEPDVAFSMNRLNNYCGKWIRHCGWYPDTKIRIWNRNSGCWSGALHEKLVFNTKMKIEKLDGDLLHFTCSSLENHLKQIEKFTNIAAEEMYNNNVKFSSIKMYVKSFAKFLSSYLLYLGFLDGHYGFVISKMAAHSVLRKYQKLRIISRK